AAGLTDLATDRRGHDGPSWTPSSHTCAISSSSLFITLDDRYDGSSQAQRSVGGLHSKSLELLEFGYWTTSLILMTNQQDGPSWLRRSVLGHTSPYSFSSCTMVPPTDRHRHDEPSQAP
ncbi:hypothetical protein EJD97_017125, partial [Solanum chilense]